RSGGCGFTVIRSSDRAASSIARIVKHRRRTARAAFAFGCCKRLFTAGVFALIAERRLKTRPLAAFHSLQRNAHLALGRFGLGNHMPRNDFVAGKQRQRLSRFRNNSRSVCLRVCVALFMPLFLVPAPRRARAYQGESERQREHRALPTKQCVRKPSRAIRNRAGRNPIRPRVMHDESRETRISCWIICVSTCAAALPERTAQRLYETRPHEMPLLDAPVRAYRNMTARSVHVWPS